jgi:hypothetical protein
VDGDGRFRCPRCNSPLKLIDEGLKKILYDWAAATLPGGNSSPEP